jgi:hypothetical protein
MNATKHTKAKPEPEWAREKYLVAEFGLSHMILYTLRMTHKIRSVSLRAEGKKFGARLYHVQSVRDYLTSQEAKEVSASSQTAPSPKS